MNSWGKDFFASMVVGLVIPGLLLNGAVSLKRPPADPMQPIPLESGPVLVRNDQGEVTEWEMEDYLVGVLLAEMPSSFQPEALKAQAVVSRTYARKALETGGKHADGSVCTRPECCQGWKSPDASPEEAVQKARTAVQETAGSFLTYDGALIEATYFSCSGGSTEDAVAVWGTAFPYLQSVDSPGEEEAMYYRDEKRFSAEELSRKLELSLYGNPEQWLGKVTYTRGGSVDTAQIAGVMFTGTELRARLDLRSAAFTIHTEGDQVIFKTKGYGHRVGMSQYGADAMAQKGHSHEEILAHYYQGTVLTQLDDAQVPGSFIVD